MIEPLLTRLVQQAPALDAVVITELTAALHADGRPLAHAIAQVIALVAQGQIDAGIALPALAMASSTLDGVPQGVAKSKQRASRADSSSLASST